MRHGGDLSEAARLFGDPPSGWVDLSTGVSPRPYPTSGLLASLTNALARLPGEADMAALLVAAREAYQVPDAVSIVAAPGTESLIRLLSHMLAGEAAILRTSYASYAEAWRAAGYPLLIRGEMAEIAAASSAAARPVCIVVNPNNPDGRIVPPMAILEAARSGAARLCLVDEAYADAEPNASLIPHLRGDDPVVVLRSFGKFFGLPGLRLGFAVGQAALLDEISSRLGDWPVSAAATTIGTAALADLAWRREARHWIGNRAATLDSVLRRGGLKVVGGTRLFRLAAAPNAPAIHEKLARAGVWTRVFSDWPDVVRFGLPGDDAAAQRLLEALAGQR